MSKIFDCFLYYNEEHIVRGRFEYLADCVDVFVVVEANLTFAGNPKPYNFETIYDALPQDIKQKIKYHKVKLAYYADPWVLEQTQRNALIDAAKLAGAQHNDFIMISDADEIPCTSALVGLSNAGISPISFRQRMFYYNLDNEQATPWLGTVGCYLQYITTANDLRENRNHPGNYIIENGGYHLSYFGDAKMIQNKIQNFSHQELNTQEFTSLEHIQAKIDNGGDLFDRPNRFIVSDKKTIDPRILNIFGNKEAKVVEEEYKHYAHDVEGYFTDEDFGFYRDMVAQAQDGATFVEVGSYRGRSTSFLGIEIARSGKNINLTAVDNFIGVDSKPGERGIDIYRDYVKNTERLRNIKDLNFLTLPFDSVAASEGFFDVSIDFVFIDGAHDYDSVVRDINAWWPKIAVGGTIAGHDIPYPDVQRAVMDTIGQPVGVKGNCWFRTKFAADATRRPVTRT